MAKQSEGVRIGPISLVTLISVLLLAVLSVLCVTTANATRTMAERQASNITETYQLDACGQSLLASINAQVAKTKSAASAAKAVSKQLDTLQQQATQKAGNGDITLNAQLKGGKIAFTAALPSGKALHGVISLNGKGTASITQWKLSTAQQASEETLWSGSSKDQ